MDTRRISCLEFGTMVNAYLECLLSIASVRSFHAHAAECHDCSSYLLSYRKMLELVREERRIE